MIVENLKLKINFKSDDLKFKLSWLEVPASAADNALRVRVYVVGALVPHFRRPLTALFDCAILLSVLRALGFSARFRHRAVTHEAC